MQAASGGHGYVIPIRSWLQFVHICCRSIRRYDIIYPVHTAGQLQYRTDVFQLFFDTEFYGFCAVQHIAIFIQVKQRSECITLIHHDGLVLDCYHITAPYGMVMVVVSAMPEIPALFTAVTSITCLPAVSPDSSNVALSTRYSDESSTRIR